MKVSSWSVEFGYELISSIPYAYWLHENGLLTETESNPGSDALYYFSPNHKIVNKKREFTNVHKMVNSGLIPNSAIHRTYLDLSKFTPPPYKKIYANKEYVFKKPIVCICNRYNVEWGKKPINFFSLNMMRDMFDKLKNDYTIIYWAVDLPDEFQDMAHSMNLGDREFIKKNYKDDVFIFQDLIKGKDWNTEQLKIFANCSKFITMNGGYSILASYFGGQNIIFSRRGVTQTKEININSFQHWYPEFGNSQIVFVDDEVKLLNKIESLLIRKNPTVNVLIRTKNRPKYLHECIKSIEAQHYDNINVIIGVEAGDIDTMNYVQKYPYRVSFYDRYKGDPIKSPKESNEYGKFFPYNRYLDILNSKVDNGYIMYLDDDDNFITETAVSDIVEEINKGKDLILWRVYSNGRKIPKDENMNKKPVCCDISGIGVCFNSKYVNRIEWGWWKRADYRVINKLYSICKKKIYVDKVLTSVQEAQHSGNALDKGGRKPVNMSGKIECEILSKKVGLIGNLIYLDQNTLNYYELKGFVKKL